MKVNRVFLYLLLKYSIVLMATILISLLALSFFGSSEGSYQSAILTTVALAFVITGYVIGLRQADEQSSGNKRKFYFSRFSSREREVAELILSGLKNKEICKHLFIENSTLKTHINRIYRKCDCSTRAEFKRLFS